MTVVSCELVQPPHPVDVDPSLFVFTRLPDRSTPTPKYAIVESRLSFSVVLGSVSCQYGRNPTTCRRRPDVDVATGFAGEIGGTIVGTVVSGVAGTPAAPMR